jgi:hypothetical protein
VVGPVPSLTSGFSMAFELVIITFVVIDFSEYFNDVQLLPLADVFIQGCTNGFFFGAMAS